MHVWFSAGFGDRAWVLPGVCSLSLHPAPVSGTVQAFAYLDLVPESFLIILKWSKNILPPTGRLEMETRTEELSRRFCECPEDRVLCGSPDNPQPVCPPRNPAGKGSTGIAAALLPAGLGFWWSQLEGGRQALKSSLVLLSISAAFEAQNKGRQLDPPVAWPSTGADCTLFCVSGLWDGGAIKASTNSFHYYSLNILLLKTKQSTFF